MSFHRDTHVKKTRAAKWCGWCGERIEAGQPSVYTTGVYEGDFFQDRYHPECHAAITRYYTKHKCWGEEMPDWAMNRGGIEEKGEPEEEEIPIANAIGEATPPEPR